MIDELLKVLASNGLLGVLLVLAMFAIWYLYRENKEERNARLDDMKDVWQEDIKFRAELKALIQNILDILRGKK